MRRGVLILLAVALTLAAIVVALRQDPGAGPGRATPPEARGPAAGEASGSAPRTTTATTQAAPGSVAPAVLERARDMLAAIEARGGEPLAGYVGGREFHNRERRLPAGRYREYDVERRVSGQARGPERVVIDQTTGRAYYTGDHYRTFVPLN
jgi:ribonuclease T1